MYLILFLKSGIIPFLEKNMLTCQWKKMGMECVSCGIQRSFIHLLKGEFTQAFYMYPAIYTVIIMFTYLVLHLKFNFKIGHKILIGLFILNIIISFTNYILKFN